jgi:hypothetical protein
MKSFLNLCVRSPRLALLRLLPLALGIMTLAGAASERASAAGGQDFPFFCKLDDSGRMLKINRDWHSPTGFVMYVIDDGKVVNGMIADVQPSRDGRYMVVQGTETSVFKQTKVLAYVNAQREASSHAAIETTLRGVDPDFALQPAHCGGDR